MASIKIKTKIQKLKLESPQETATWLGSQLLSPRSLEVYSYSDYQFNNNVSRVVGAPESSYNIPRPACMVWKRLLDVVTATGFSTAYEQKPRSVPMLQHLLGFSEVLSCSSTR